ncbi:MAG: hypothetical protein MUE44_29340 [Oscillatoriaceae cyanobacterium Prado104]|nr:hypothetical protein [Oscillatoriaceae cyanobacterium Prado104]
MGKFNVVWEFKLASGGQSALAKPSKRIALQRNYKLSTCFDSPSYGTSRSKSANLLDSCHEGRRKKEEGRRRKEGTTRIARIHG